MDALDRLCHDFDEDRINTLNQITDELLAIETHRCRGPAVRNGAACHACGGRLVNMGGEVACKDCARVKHNFVDRSVENRGAFEDSRRTPIERHGMAIDPNLPRSSMTTFVHVEGRKTKATYNMVTMGVRSRLDPKERARESVLRMFDNLASKHGIPPATLAACKNYYVRISKQKINRGNQKEGIIAACMSMAFKVNNSHRTPQQMGEMFNTSPANVIAGTRTLYNYLHLSVTPATALNHVVMYARALNMAPHHISTCEVLCKRISLQDSQLNTYTPSSLAAGVVMWTCQALGLPHTRKDVEAATSVSSVTISKCINAMAQIAGDLEERVAVRLRANEDGTVAVDFTVV